MQLVRAAQRGLLLVAAGLVTLSNAPTADARRKPPVIEAPPMPPPPPPMPDVALANHFTVAAGVYDSYVRDAAAISPGFTDPANVESSLRTGVDYQPAQLRVGAVAYGAIAALTDAEFVDAVRRAGPTPEARYALVAHIYSDPKSVLAFAGARRAEGLAKAALVESGMRLFTQGDAVKQAAYDIQHQPWSLEDIPNRDGRAATVKKLSTAERSVPGSETAMLHLMIAGELPTGANLEPQPPPDTSLVLHAVALAALAAIGQAGDQDAPHLGWLTDDYYLDHCLDGAKLSLFECLAVAKPSYEDVFCLGQHAMKDTASCIVIGAGGAVPIELVPADMKIAPVHLRKPERRRRRSRRG